MCLLERTCTVLPGRNPTGIPAEACPCCAIRTCFLPHCALTSTCPHLINSHFKYTSVNERDDLILIHMHIIVGICKWVLLEGVRFLDLELQAVVSGQTWMLGTKLRSPGRTTALNPWAVSPAFVFPILRSWSTCVLDCVSFFFSSWLITLVSWAPSLLVVE